MMDKRDRVFVARSTATSSRQFPIYAKNCHRQTVLNSTKTTLPTTTNRIADIVSKSSIINSRSKRDHHHHHPNQHQQAQIPIKNTLIRRRVLQANNNVANVVGVSSSSRVCSNLSSCNTNQQHRKLPFLHETPNHQRYNKNDNNNNQTNNINNKLVVGKDDLEIKSNKISSFRKLIRVNNATKKQQEAHIDLTPTLRNNTNHKPSTASLHAQRLANIKSSSSSTLSIATSQQAPLRSSLRSNIAAENNGNLTIKALLMKKSSQPLPFSTTFIGSSSNQSVRSSRSTLTTNGINYCAANFNESNGINSNFSSGICINKIPSTFSQHSIHTIHSQSINNLTNIAYNNSHNHLISSSSTHNNRICSNNNRFAINNNNNNNYNLSSSISNISSIGNCISDKRVRAISTSQKSLNFTRTQPQNYRYSANGIIQCDENETYHSNTSNNLHSPLRESAFLYTDSPHTTNNRRQHIHFARNISTSNISNNNNNNNNNTIIIKRQPKTATKSSTATINPSTGIIINLNSKYQNNSSDIAHRPTSKVTFPNQQVAFTNRNNNNSIIKTSLEQVSKQTEPSSTRTPRRRRAADEISSASSSSKSSLSSSTWSLNNNNNNSSKPNSADVQSTRDNNNELESRIVNNSNVSSEKNSNNKISTSVTRKSSVKGNTSKKIINSNNNNHLRLESTAGKTSPTSSSSSSSSSRSGFSGSRRPAVKRLALTAPSDISESLSEVAGKQVDNLGVFANISAPRAVVVQLKRRTDNCKKEAHNKQGSSGTVNQLKTRASANQQSSRAQKSLLGSAGLELKKSAIVNSLRSVCEAKKEEATKINANAATKIAKEGPLITTEINGSHNLEACSINEPFNLTIVNSTTKTSVINNSREIDNYIINNNNNKQTNNNNSDTSVIITSYTNNNNQHTNNNNNNNSLDEQQQRQRQIINLANCCYCCCRLDMINDLASTNSNIIIDDIKHDDNCENNKMQLIKNTTSENSFNHNNNSNNNNNFNSQLQSPSKANIIANTQAEISTTTNPESNITSKLTTSTSQSSESVNVFSGRKSLNDSHELEKVNREAQQVELELKLRKQVKDEEEEENMMIITTSCTQQLATNCNNNADELAEHINIDDSKQTANKTCVNQLPIDHQQYTNPICSLLNNDIIPKNSPQQTPIEDYITKTNVDRRCSSLGEIEILANITNELCPTDSNVELNITEANESQISPTKITVMNDNIINHNNNNFSKESNNSAKKCDVTQPLGLNQTDNITNECRDSIMTTIDNLSHQPTVDDCDMLENDISTTTTSPIINKNVHIPIRLDSINDIYDMEPKPFARGKFAQVKRCVKKSTMDCYAAKCIKKRRRQLDMRSDILLEIEALKLSYMNEFIVKIFEVFETSSEMILVLEMAEGGELQRVVDEEERLEEPCAKQIISQILNGLACLHQNDIAHLDIKPQNILLTQAYPNCRVKLCDFGMSRKITKDCELREICGTPDYVAPEILRYDPICLTTDMWSLGILAYVLLSGYSPFGGESKQQTFCNITQAPLDFPSEIFDNISSDAIDFMRKTIVRNPNTRMTSRQASGHAWLSPR